MTADPVTDVVWGGLTVYGTFRVSEARQVLTVTSAPTAEHTIRVWGVWRGSRVLILTISCPGTCPEARWGAGWVDNPPDWRRDIENGAVAVYRRWIAERGRTP
ncbi:hypothetical protein LX16_2612 [Stackebrandtia albiflava]|uniref:Uncharacterized protein n=1 Tax=Stackebrandtia albiflava TaxID=406432 RepID=A0A562V1W9_9ACTN|nr:hypothetical protein [Stackebrandtia albiflava]TWJ11874.1 hypothetical protein LX16_2612 [Stackebrandtia albiflava]